MRLLLRGSARRVLPVCLGLLLPAALEAQERTYELGLPSWVLQEPLSGIAGIGRLPDGRVLIADSRDRVLVLASADGASLAPFGSQGRGPGEYLRPLTILRDRGDTLLVYDAGNRRYLRVRPDGRSGPDLPVPVAFLRAGGLAPPRGIDAVGALYWQGDAVGTENGAPKRNERQNVRRWHPGRDVLDTVAAVRDHAASMHRHRFFPFAERDAFVVARDGRVGVLSAGEYRLRWYRDRELVATGPALSFARTPVTPGERAAFRRTRAMQVSGMAGIDGAVRGGSFAEASQQVAAAFPDDLFPSHLPAFVENGVLLSPAEDLWVVRSAAWDAPRTRIDVLAPDGARRGHLLLPSGRRLVALAPEGVYLVRVDEDGLEWLERYAWPQGTR